MDKKLMESMKMMKSNTQVLSKTINSLVKEEFNTKSQKIFMKGKSIMEKCTVREKCSIQTGIFMKVTLIMAYTMEKEFIFGRVGKFIRVLIRKE